MDHTEKAAELFRRGYNCSQSVFAAFADVMGMDEAFALKLSSSFGGGIGRMREVCGTCSAMFMVLGAIEGYTEPNNSDIKSHHYAKVQHLAAEFKKRHYTIICRDLLKDLAADSSPYSPPRDESFYRVRPCIKFVISAAEILDAYLASGQNDNQSRRDNTSL